MALKFDQTRSGLYVPQSSGGTDFCAGCYTRLGYTPRVTCDTCHGIVHDSLRCYYYDLSDGFRKCRNCHATD